MLKVTFADSILRVTHRKWLTTAILLAFGAFTCVLPLLQPDMPALVKGWVVFWGAVIAFMGVWAFRYRLDFELDVARRSYRFHGRQWNRYVNAEGILRPDFALQVRAEGTADDRSYAVVLPLEVDGKPWPIQLDYLPDEQRAQAVLERWRRDLNLGSR